MQISPESTRAGVFLNNVAGLKAYNLIKKRLQHKCFPLKFATVLGTHFLKSSSDGYFYYLLIIVKEGQSHHVLMKEFSTFMYTIIKYYIVIETMFAIIAFNLLVLRRCYKEIVIIVFKLMATIWLKWLKKVKLLNLKTIREKQNSWFMIIWVF